MKRISILALPLILTSFFTVLVSRIVIFFIPEIAVLFGASREAFPMWRRSVVDLKLTIPILSGPKPRIYKSRYAGSPGAILFCNI